MRYKLLFLMLLFANAAFGKSKWSVKTVFTEPAETQGSNYTADSLTFNVMPSFYGNGNEGAISFHIENNTTQRIYIEWENARIEGSRIAFGDDRVYQLNEQKSDEAVASGEWSIDRVILPVDYISDYSVIPLWSKRTLKKGYVQTASLIIPIRKTNGAIKDYKLQVKFVYTE